MKPMKIKNKENLHILGGICEVSRKKLWNSYKNNQCQLISEKKYIKL